jgi:hypothetical protein
MSTELKKVYTITYGDVAENHAKMQKIGTLHENGYSIEHIEKIEKKLNELGLTTEMVDLNAGFDPSFEDAKVLVIRKGAQFILGEENCVGLMEENDNLTMDKKAFMKGKVVNKVARWNLCFADEDQEPNYEDGKGRIVSWGRIPKMSRIRQVISEWTEDVLLNGEANYYYDISKCGIGFHGDGERKKVFAVRMGETMSLYFKWFQNSLPIGEPFEVVLNDGDMYIMSEKAVGFDWLKKKTATLRHSTGCSKFTGINEDGVVVVGKKEQKRREVLEVKKSVVEVSCVGVGVGVKVGVKDMEVSCVEVSGGVKDLVGKRLELEIKKLELEIKKLELEIKKMEEGK